MKALQQNIIHPALQSRIMKVSGWIWHFALVLEGHTSTLLVNELSGKETSMAKYGMDQER